MRRIMLLGVVALLITTLMMAGALPAFGAANRHANCMGAAHSRQHEPGIAGAFHAGYAHEGLNGEVASDFARFVTGGGKGGKDRVTLGSGLTATGISCGPF